MQLIIKNVETLLAYLYELYYDLRVSVVDQSPSVFNTYRPQQKGCFLPQRPYATKGRAAKEVDSASRRWEWKEVIRTDSGY